MSTVIAPRLNANEDVLALVAVHVEPGAAVRAGDPVVTVESTKVRLDLTAPTGGFVRLRSLRPGERIEVGAILFQIVEAPPLDPIFAPQRDVDQAPPEAAPAARPATERAAALALAWGVDLAAVPARGIVKARDVEDFLAARAAVAPGPELAWEEADVVLVGAGGHARAVLDLARAARPELRVAAALDDRVPVGGLVDDVPVIGPLDRLDGLRRAGLRAALLGVGAVHAPALRRDLYARLRALGLEIPALVHPRAVVERSARIAPGAQVFAGAIVGAAARVGEGAIINQGAILSHDCVIEDHAHIAPGALLAGAVQVGALALVGMGATVYLGVRIGARAVVNNGMNVFSDVEDDAIVR